MNAFYFQTLRTTFQVFEVAMELRVFYELQKYVPCIFSLLIGVPKVPLRKGLRRAVKSRLFCLYYINHASSRIYTLLLRYKSADKLLKELPVRFLNCSLQFRAGGLS